MHEIFVDRGFELDKVSEYDLNLLREFSSKFDMTAPVPVKDIENYARETNRSYQIFRNVVNRLWKAGKLRKFAIGKWAGYNYSHTIRLGHKRAGRYFGVCYMLK